MIDEGGQVRHITEETMLDKHPVRRSGSDPTGGAPTWLEPHLAPAPEPVQPVE
ncbi:MAG: hypothetical protein M3071_05655 [Actinomycetota bacterium]|nr:hypothetical protein [Actinomycetota bacterium]